MTDTIAFLERLRPGGPWVLTAIIPDGPTKTITVHDETEVRDFIQRYDGTHNLYYSANPLRRAMSKKAAKTDIAAIEYLPADLDPNKKIHERPNEAKARYLKALNGRFPYRAWEIIDSGNGLQALWKLATPILLGEPVWNKQKKKLEFTAEDAAKIADAEARSEELMKMLGSVAGTQNIDRILRLPGTTNLPNEAKRKEGYVKCESAHISSGAEVYELEDLPAPKKAEQEKQRSPGRPPGKKLPNKLTEKLYLLDAGAGAPVGPYPSRSELMFSFVGLALREGIDDEDIIDACQAIKYKGCAIYEHCIEKGGEKYIRGQIEHALNNADPDTAEDQKLIIKTRKGGLTDETDQTEKALRAARCPVYFRGGILVEPIWRYETFIDGKRREHQTLSVVLRKLTVPQLRYMVGKHAAIYQKFNGTTKRWEQINPPIEVMEQLLSLGHWGFPTIKGIINSPTMRPDGSLLTEQGYDALTRLWYKSTADLRLPDIPERPTRGDAIAAVQLLKDLLGGFPFVNDISLSVALAGIMTPVLRGAFDAAPIFLFVAPEAGTGKTYIITVISTIATGRLPVSIAATSNKEEMEKRLSAVAFAARPITSINNVDFNFESALLCQMITEGKIGIRLFGRNDQPIECDTRSTTTFLNGNNITVVGDLVRRTLKSKMDAKVDDPESRNFDFDPVEWVKADRGKYLAAIFTIVRAYQAAGSPKGDVKPLGGFEGWSEFVRYPLLWLGYADPAGSIAELRADDPSRGGLRLRIEALLDVFGTDRWFLANEVFNKAEERSPTMGPYGGPPTFRYPELVEAFRNENGKPATARTIGSQLAIDVDRVVNGYKLDVKKDPKHGNRYRLVGEPPRQPKGETL